MAEKKKSFRGCLWGLVALSALMIIVGIGVLLVSIVIGRTGRTSHAKRTGMGVDEYPRMNEVWSNGHGDTKVVRIPLHGFIHLQPDTSILGSTRSSTQLALMAIRRATHDKNVKAIMMDVDSGGGGITASDILYKALVDFKKSQPGRVVVAMCGDVAASGAYYVSLAADHIVAHPTTVTGSIGVIMQGLNMRELSEKVGITDITIKSGENKDLMNPFHDISPEQHEILQNIVDEMHARFVGLVVEHRQMDESEARRLSDGRIVTAPQAEKLGLIDQVGYWDDAIAKTAELLQVDDIKVYRYEEEFSLSLFLRSFQRFNPAAAFLKNASQPRLLYRWQL